jgi:hypothetical protein
MQLPVQSWSAALPVPETGPEESIKRRYRSAKRRYPYMFLNVDIEESSISNHPDIEVETSISTFLQYRGTLISKFTKDDTDTYSFDIEVAYRTRYRRNKSKRRYRRFMMPISAYTDIGYKTSISTSWQGSRCSLSSSSSGGSSAPASQTCHGCQSLPHQPDSA